MFSPVKPLMLGDLAIKIPIIQGGMGVKVSDASLAGAVANCGAAGTIASVGLGLGITNDKNPAEFAASSIKGLISEIKKARLISPDGAIGVNILSALSNFADLAKAAAQEKIDYIISGAGLPLRLPEYVAGTNIKIIPIVSSGRVANLIIKSWQRKYNRLPDAIIVEGPLAGGHLGFSVDEVMEREEGVLEERVAEVIKVTKDYSVEGKPDIPVVAAGGIFDGEDIARFMKLGAKAVQMGTRFVTTDECSVPAEFKQKYIDATDDDIVLIKSPVGLPGRAIRTAFTDLLMRKESERPVCKYKCLKKCNFKAAPYCIACKLKNAVSSLSVEDAVVFAGKNVTKIKEIIPVKELINSLVTGAKKYL